MRKRRTYKYTRAKIWTFLRDNPGSGVAAIALGLSLKKGSTSNALCRLRDVGKARVEGCTHKAVWYAMGEKPISQSGLHVNSQANLYKTRSERQKLLRLAYIAKGIDPDSVRPRLVRRPHTYYTGELERCWPLSPANNRN